MKNQTRVRLGITIAAVFVIACSGIAETSAHHDFTLVGSTACDASVKTALGISPETKCDFIRWSVAIDPTKSNAYSLEIEYGESQPNTLGFSDATRRKLTASGKFEIEPHSIGTRKISEVYRLRSKQPAIDVSIVRLNANLYHLTMPDGTLMIGNGGWSYTLNRSTPLKTAVLPAASFAAAPKTMLIEQVFDGRTPCPGIAAVIDVRDNAECLKIKWRITLSRDPVTLTPTTFTIKGINPDRQKTLEGSWTEKRLTAQGPTVLTLTSEGSQPISLMAVDENLLFFLDGSGRPLVGNKDFSYTLNRKS